MKTRQTLFLVLMVFVLALAACAPVEMSTNAPAETPVEITAELPTEVSAEASACPSAMADSKLLTNEADGYCFLYPAEYISNNPSLVVINPISAPGDVPGDAWLDVEVQDAAGKTAAQIVDEQIASLGEGFNITHVAVDLDGEQAIVVDGLPGQDSNRQVFIVHNGRLYDLIFMPWFPDAAEPTPLEDLYKAVVESFQFLP
jgi:hypothetical protein